MRLLMLPDHAGQEERHFTATRAALKYYGLRLECSGTAAKYFGVTAE